MTDKIDFKGFCEKGLERDIEPKSKDEAILRNIDSDLNEYAWYSYSIREMVDDNYTFEDVLKFVEKYRAEIESRGWVIRESDDLIVID